MTTICRWLFAALLLAGCDGPQFKSTDITGAPYGKALELADTQGRMRHLEDFRGNVLVLFFGFTRCPDICPTMPWRTSIRAPTSEWSGVRSSIVAASTDRPASW